MTAQNHEVQVVGDSLPAGSGFRVSQVNLNDGRSKGLRHATCRSRPSSTTPKGAPGPLDALAVFDRFVDRVPAGPVTAPRAAGVPRPASVLILGSGPVVIGQAAEFDYAGTQACRALRAEGVRTILVNSNPATIMTDPTVADAVYLEPLTVDAIEAVIAREQPEGLLAGLGGQTALNLATALADAGVLDRHGVRLLGTPLEAIRMAEDREAFRDLLDRIGQPYAPVGDRGGCRRCGPPRVGGRGAGGDRAARDHPAGVHPGRDRRRHRRDRGGLLGARPVGPARQPDPAR